MSSVPFPARLRDVAARARKAQTHAARLEGHAWFRWLARGGIATRGAIYVLLAYIALDIAIHGGGAGSTGGAGSGGASGGGSEGALQLLAGRPGGPALLALFAVGCAFYGCWRLAQAVTGRENPREKRGALVRLGWLAIAALYLVLCAQALELAVGRQPGTGGGGGSGSPQSWAARVLSLPGGPELLGAVAVGCVVGGLALALWGFLHDYDDDLCLEKVSPAWRRTVMALGGAGDLARGATVGLVGIYLLRAAVDGRPSKAKGVDQALESLAHSPAGGVAIGVIAAGLLCFALYSFAEARLREL